MNIGASTQSLHLVPNSIQESDPFSLWYRCVVGLALGVVYLAQKPICIRLTGESRVIGGYVVSALLVLLLVEFGTLAFACLGRHFLPAIRSAKAFPVVVVAAALLLLVGNLICDPLYRLVTAVPSPVPPRIAIFVFS